MPMERDNHESLLNELINPELDQTRKTEILQELRVDYGTVLADHKDLTDKNAKLSLDNSDLVVSNSKLFRQIGVTGTDKEKDVEKQEFSETVTLEELERG